MSKHLKVASEPPAETIEALEAALKGLEDSTERNALNAAKLREAAKRCGRSCTPLPEELSEVDLGDDLVEEG